MNRGDVLKDCSTGCYCKCGSRQPCCRPVNLLAGDILIIEYESRRGCLNAVSLGYVYSCKCWERLARFKRTGS